MKKSTRARFIQIFLQTLRPAPVPLAAPSARLSPRQGEHDRIKEIGFGRAASLPWVGRVGRFRKHRVQGGGGALGVAGAQRVRTGAWKGSRWWISGSGTTTMVRRLGTRDGLAHLGLDDLGREGGRRVKASSREPGRIGPGNLAFKLPMREGEWVTRPSRQLGLVLLVEEGRFSRRQQPGGSCRP